MVTLICFKKYIKTDMEEKIKKKKRKKKEKENDVKCLKKKKRLFKVKVA